MTTIVQAKKRMNILLTHSFGDPAFYTRFQSHSANCDAIYDGQM